MLSILRRWRRSQGFGVHSPFAFSFIREVLRERRCAYYAYADIAREVACREGAISEKDALLLYRVVVNLSPAAAHVAVGGERRVVVRDILRRAGVGESDCADFYYGDIVPAEQPTYTFLTNQKGIPPLLGQVFVNRRGTVVAVNRPGLPSQTYEIMF